MPDARCIGQMEAQIRTLTNQVNTLENEAKQYVTKDELRDLAHDINLSITANHNAVMALLTPLHESSLKSKSFISGMFFVITALSGVLAVVINYAIDHFKG